MEHLTAKIERYLSDEMKLEEKLLFEKELALNESLKNEVELQLKTKKLLEANSWLKTKEHITKLNSSRKNKSSTILKIAAILVLVLIPSYFLIQRTYQNENLYLSYYSTYPDRITTMGDNNKQLEGIMVLYNARNYKEALEALENIETGDPLIILYKAICYAETNKLIQAITLLEEIKSKNTPYSLTIEWYLILFYLANNEDDKAKVLLQDFLLKNDGYQHENALELSKDLHSIWR